MIHVATVHWRTDKWIDIQLRHLDRHLDSPYRAYACLTEIEERQASRFFFACTTHEGQHPEKLNYLAAEIASQASDDDILLFVDGDAFPIAQLDQQVASMLADRPLAAVRRDENMRDPQPHPSFCATTVGFWKEIEGDWSPGYRWRNQEGVLVTDIGANLLEALEERDVDWMALLRTNIRNLHPVLYGVYGDLIYHHGCGFRPPVTRTDRAETRELLGVSGKEFSERWQGEMKMDKAMDNLPLSELVFERIKDDDQFVRELFLDP